MFLCDWKNIDNLISDFQIESKELEGVNILLAYYNYEFCEGNAYVLFEKDGKLYECHGGHCSCYGLEGQWEPEEVDLNYLEYRMNHKDDHYFNYDESIFYKYYTEVINKLKGDQ